MDQETLFTTLVRWNYWGKRAIQELRQRELHGHILAYLDEPYPVVLIGIRRSGKSSLLYLLMQQLIAQGVDRKQLLFVNFEEPVFSQHLSIPFLEKLVALYRERINPDQKIYFFFDEIQNLPEWEKWMRREADLREHKIFLTGSSAKLMSSEIATLLTGRHYTFSVYPLSFREFLQWQDIPHKTPVEQTGNKALIRNALLQYAEWGGFPEVVLSENNEKRDKILHQYFDDILYKDVVVRHKIRDTPLLQAIAEQYMTNMAAICSFNRIGNVLRTPIDNVRRYAGFLEETQLISLLKKFSYKLSLRQTGNQKVYVADTGLRNAITFRFTRDLGRSAENIVTQELRRKSRELFYFGNQKECDFLVKQAQTWLPVQVCYSDLADEKTRARELQGLIAAMNEVEVSNGLLLSDDAEGEETHDKRTIRIVPLWKFLLE